MEIRGDDSEGNTKTSKSPRINQRKDWFFTWNNYPSDALETLELTFKTNAVKYVWQEETGENGTPHIQGCLRLKKRGRWSEFGLPKTIHWEACLDFENACLYCSKQETRSGRCVRFGFPAELQLIETLRPFQATLRDWSQTVPNDRKIVWIADERGNMGKTKFCKYMAALHGAVIATGGKTADIAQILAGMAESGRDLNSPFTFILNVPRDMPARHVKYRALEGVKDGLLTSPKYESQTLIFNSPHVWVFANEMPEMTTLTDDRWEVYKITQNYDLERVYG